MGQQGQQYILVIMTNSDVYYVDKDDFATLRDAMWRQTLVVGVTDNKSGARLILQIAHISSIVDETPRG